MNRTKFQCFLAELHMKETADKHLARPRAPRFARRPAQALAQAGKGRGAAGKACARMAARPLPLCWRMRAACCVAALATLPPAPQSQRADSLRPHPPRHAATRAQHSQPAHHADCMRASKRPRAYSHSSAGRPRRSRMAPRHVGRTRRQALSGGAKRPPETPRPRSSGDTARNGRCQATPATASRPRRSDPGASAPGARRRRPA